MNQETKKTLSLESQADPEYLLLYHSMYHRDQYYLIQYGEYTGMSRESKQEMDIPETVFEEWILRLIKHNKSLQVRALEVIKEEIKNPTRICDRCHESVTDNIQKDWCRRCLNNHG